MSDLCPTCDGKGVVMEFPFATSGPVGPCPDCASPQPDTAPEGPWTVEHNTVLNEAEDAEIQVYRTNEGAEVLAERLAAALNGAPATPAERAVIDAAYLDHQREWSLATFGPGTRLHGVLDHIRKELAEIEADPTDVTEWVDVIILAFDGAWRAGWEPQQIIDAIVGKQARNEARTWPDWRTMSEDQAIEHDRTQDGDR